jgi:hypothetical protein
MNRKNWALAPAAAGLLLALGAPAAVSAPAAVPMSFAKEILLQGSDGHTEPRIAVAPNGTKWIAANSKGTLTMYHSRDGINWDKNASTLAGQTSPTIDVDVVVTRTGRIVATELDFAGINFVVGYSDDGGKTWTASTGLAQLGDQDRQWLAVGPDDPSSHQPTVYLLFHNLGSGTAQHNMFVEKSTDGGASFGPPVPTTLPGDQAYADLQCADSGGPSNVMVNPRTGRVYVVFGTRGSVVGPLELGGCGASTASFQINIVAATRAWVATSPDGSAGSWTQSMAVDNVASQKIIGMQLNPGTMDSAGNIYVGYPESARAYPDYSGGSVKMTWAPPDLSHWSTPVTVAPARPEGHTLVHLVAGDPGKVDLAYFKGFARAGKNPVWYAYAAQTLDGLSASPTFTETKLSGVAAATGTASELMGACNPSMPQSAGNGFTCGRSTDVWGMTLDKDCVTTIVWPVQAGDAGAKAGTYVSQQTAGSTLCGAGTLGTAAAPPTVVPSPSPTRAPLPNTGTTPGSSHPGLALVIVIAVAAAAGGLARMRPRLR